MDKTFVMRDDLSPEMKANMERLRDCIIIAFVKRAGGKVEFSTKEIDEANDMLTTEVDAVTGKFILEIQRRN